VPLHYSIKCQLIFSFFTSHLNLQLGGPKLRTITSLHCKRGKRRQQCHSSFPTPHSHPFFHFFFCLSIFFSFDSVLAISGELVWRFVGRHGVTMVSAGEQRWLLVVLPRVARGGGRRWFGETRKKRLAAVVRANDGGGEVVCDAVGMWWEWRKRAWRGFVATT